jgi:lipopolysaccharide export system protein LptA
MIAAAMLGLAIGPYGFALESDRDQPIRVRATQVSVNEKTGVTVYQGRVEAVQGSLRITADRVVVRRRDGRTEHVHATGRPLTLKQKPDPESPEIHIEARRLEYDIRHNAVEFFDEVVVTQARDQMKSAYLFYKLDGEIMRARATKDGEDRVQAVLHPKIKDKELP